MLVHRAFGAILIMLVLAGCGSSVSVHSDYDVNAPFEDYRSYSWLERSTVGGGPGDVVQASSDLVQERIRNAVDLSLRKAGFAQNDENPDLLVVTHLTVETKVGVTDWGYSYSDYYWGRGGRDIDIYDYKEGTLLIDLVDAQTKKLVWRGAGQKTLSDRQLSPAEQQQRINDVVAQIMEEYPPRRQ